MHSWKLIKQQVRLVDLLENYERLLELLHPACRCQRGHGRAKTLHPEDYSLWDDVKTSDTKTVGSRGEFTHVVFREDNEEPWE